MSTFAVRAIGFCAQYSPQGDWAFDFALRLARARSVRLNVFHFLTNPYDPGARMPESLSRGERSALAIRLERELRLYYDARLGDYLDAGFRLCEDPEWTELHRCLTKREFQVLVLGYPHEGATFGGVPIEEFVTQLRLPGGPGGSELSARPAPERAGGPASATSWAWPIGTTSRCERPAPQSSGERDCASRRRA